MEKILREVLTNDKSLLCRRDELIAVLEKKVPADKMRDFTPVKRAISLNVGEKFFVGENDKSATTAEVEKILKSSGMQEARIEFVVDTFTKALDWDKPLIPPSMQKKSDAHEVATNTVEDDVPDVPDVPEKISVPVSTTQTVEDNDDPVAAFNALADKNGFALNEARKDFLNRYNVRAFTCTNFQERMNEPVPPPEFVDATSGEYWAVPVIDNRFAVFPNVKFYTDNFHNVIGMGEVFRSNFTTGKTYKKIIVDKPAVFECSGTVWQLKTQGFLTLSGESESVATSPVDTGEKTRVKIPPPPESSTANQAPVQPSTPQPLPRNHKSKIFTTEGRLNRWAYFLQSLKVLFIAFIGAALVDHYIGVPILLAAMVGGWLVGVRRLHDLNKSGWFLLVSLIPYVNFVFSLYLIFAPGTHGVNKYGPDPLTE